MAKNKENKSKKTERSVLSYDFTCMNGHVELIEITTFEKTHSFDYRVEVLIGTTKVKHDNFDSETEAYATYHRIKDTFADFTPVETE